MEGVARVQKGTGGPSYFWDGTHQMTPLAGSGMGAVLDDDFDVPNTVLTTEAFTVLNNQLAGRDIGFADLIAQRTALHLAGNQAFLQAVADAVNGT